MLVLASASPRRRDLLTRMGHRFSVVAADVDESPRPGESAVDLVRRLALAKAEAVAADRDDVVVIGADTVVEVDGDVLGKPADDAEAAAMLGRLAGRTHRVVTGVAVLRRSARPVPPVGSAASAGSSAAVTVVAEVTEVTFGPLSAVDIAGYVATGEPRDKAGAYAIQGIGGQFVASITGNYDNVVGLPTHRLRLLLAEHGVPPADPLDEAFDR